MCIPAVAPQKNKTSHVDSTLLAVLLSLQNKEMRRYAPAPRPAEGRPRGSSAAASGLTAQYLEAVDAYETEEDEEDDLGLSATERARRNLQRRGMEVWRGGTRCLCLFWQLSQKKGGKMKSRLLWRLSRKEAGSNLSRGKRMKRAAVGRGQSWQENTKTAEIACKGSVHATLPMHVCIA
jgi:hypothetical protein